MMSAADERSEAEPALGASRVGAELRAARLRLGWSLPDVAATLRIRLPYLDAIEDGRVSELPGSAYAVGFVRSYATFLGLDPAEVARRFRAEAHEVNRKPELQFPVPVPERGVPAGAVVLVGVVIAVGSYAAWYNLSGDRPAPAPVIPAVPERLAPLADRAVPLSNPSPQVASILPPPGAPAAAPAPTPPPPPAPVISLPTPTPVPVVVSAAPLPPGEASRLVLRMKTEALIQVREKQGPVLLNRVMRAGETWPVPKGQQLLLSTSDAAGTELLVDGVVAPPLGSARVLRRDVVLDPDLVKAGSVPPPKPAPAAPAQ